ncbi:hypothetical protein [Catenibacterium sp. RTP21428st1_D7_RTP21428_210409]|uniref:hypothetical protein n=1 Tax=unclassified Catenibacterium TaxID=2643636 RepID=UPI0032F035AD
MLLIIYTVYWEVIISVRRLLKNFLSVALVVLLVFLCYKAYIYQKTFEEIRDSKGGYFEETIEIK